MLDPFTASWMADVPLEAREALRDAALLVQYPKAETVHSLGVWQGSLWGVRQGQVRVLVETNEMAPVLGHIHAPGAWFGEVESALSIEAYVQMEAVAGTSLYRVDFSRFKSVADSFPSIREHLMRLTALNLRFATSAANDLVLRTSEMRVAATLLRLSGNRAAFQGNPPLVTINASQQEIAVLANVARTTASKVLLELQAQEMIRLNYGHIDILSVGGL